MPRLIDAHRIVYSWTIDNDGEQHDGVTLQSIIDKLPTVDAEPVVRCKDCKHREVQVDGVFRYEMCGIRNEIINLEGFCHMGERREDAEEE